VQFRAVSFHSEVWGGAPTEIEFGSLHFSFKIRHLLAAILMIFPRINLPNFVQFKQYKDKILFTIKGWGGAKPGAYAGLNCAT